MRIAILLATYNSERFLTEQIDSILNQSYQNWILYIRDDGSSDRTLEIIGEFQQSYPDKIRLIKDGERGLGAYHNFIRMLYTVDADFYMFSDHDDVWLPDKVLLSVNMIKDSIEKYGNNIPLLVHSDMKVVDENLNTINSSFWKYCRLLPNHVRFEELIFCNSVNGCTILINQKAKDISLSNISYCVMHDVLLAQSVSAGGGKIVKVDEPTLLYRQHFNNVVGAVNANRKYFFERAIHLTHSLMMFLSIIKNAQLIKKTPIWVLIYYKVKTLILRALV